MSADSRSRKQRRCDIGSFRSARSRERGDRFVPRAGFELA
jgi:hypothetical protein